jgi:esterase/lipase superfamily enzyme
LPGAIDTHAAPIAETSPKASRVNLLVATTRSRSSVPGEMFSGERALKPAFADITVSIPPDSARKVGEVAWPKRLPPNPSKDSNALVGGSKRARTAATGCAAERSTQECQRQ